MIGVVQSTPRGMTYTFTLSIAGEYWMKDNTLLGTSVYTADADLAKRSTCSFSYLGIYTNLTENSLPILLLTTLNYSFIRSPFAS